VQLTADQNGPHTPVADNAGCHPLANGGPDIDAPTLVHSAHNSLGQLTHYKW